MIRPRGVVERRSSDVPLYRDADLSRAVQYMRRHATEGITVGQVLDAVNVSRRSFEQRFLKATGRTPAEELRRLRLEHACRLLSTTQMSLMDVATQSGFSNNGNFSRAFKQGYGMTPRAYRRQAILGNEARVAAPADQYTSR